MPPRFRSPPWRPHTARCAWSPSGVGTVRAWRTVSVRPQVDGQLLSTSFVEGQEVRAGDVLARIDPRPYQAALDQALAKRAQDKAQLANAREDLQRYAQLLDKQFASRQQVEAVRARVAALEAAVLGDDAAIEAARLQLDHTTVRAPMDGRAGLAQVDPGNIVSGSRFDGPRSGGGSGGGAGGSGGPGGSDTIVVLTQTRPISVSFTLPQDQLPQVLAAQGKGRLEVAASVGGDDKPIDRGWLEAIDSQVDSATGTIKLKAQLPNADNQLWPGQFVTARLLVGVRPQAIALPATAVLRGPQGEYAYVVKEDSTVDPRPVVTGMADEHQVEIVKGIEAGETVVVSGQSRLRPGARIAARAVKGDDVISRAD
ncbi:MAG: efflux RND transporter periplasmic adaptor subunit [Magnetospirillum sp.]|nr:efflux RND transporter periplasmic adaptor subunit [Magnetospirillum sp.]